MPSPSSQPFVAAAALLSLVLVGCASGTNELNSLFGAGPGARFSGSSEKAFFAGVEKRCSAFSVGDQRLGDLIDKDDAFRALTQALYRGEMSNDEYVQRLLALHPAADGNVPATGCVIQQFNDCVSGDCDPSQPPEQAPAETAPATEAGVAEPADGPTLEAEL